jgi:hopene-associated glycosyltransferase HpnB
MHAALFIAATLCLVAWLYLAFNHGRFWMVQQLGAPKNTARPYGFVAVVIPARDEADAIGRAVGSLLEQQYPEPLHIFVVDDHSSDGTAEAARNAARNSPRPHSLTVIAGEFLPAGWTGKLWAVQQGVERALVLQPRFLLLTDADIAHSPDNLTTLVALADAGGYDLTSFMVKLRCHNLPEKLLIPAFVFFFLQLYPPLWVRDPHRRIAGAAGGCMLVRPEALIKAGGVAAIRGEIIDDCALAQAVKRSGGKVWLGLTRNAFSLRPYHSFAEVEHMVARNAFNQLRHSPWLLAGALLGMTLLYLLPLALLFSRSLSLTVLGAAALLLMFAIYLPVIRLYELNVLWVLTLPFSAVFYMVATFHSALKYWSGRGGEWKGRAQDSGASFH